MPINGALIISIKCENGLSHKIDFKIFKSSARYRTGVKKNNSGNTDEITKLRSLNLAPKILNKRLIQSMLIKNNINVRGA